MGQIIADFRSDTVTRPSDAMRQVMATAQVGDDVWGDDPTVNHLEAYIAQRTGKEAALFCASGTQSNLVALMAHCERGDEYIVGQDAHTYKYEGGGAAVLGSIQPQPVEFEADSTLDLNKVKAKIKADDFHFARTRLLCLENTRSGEVLPFDYHAQAAAFCAEHGLALHLDGARLFNAIVAQGVTLNEICQHYDSVSLCISKGLGAPVGSLLVGSAALMHKARRWRKLLGGGMRQAGILAAGCHYALENNIPDLAHDHSNASALAAELAAVPGIVCNPALVQTNMVFATVQDSAKAEPLTQFLKARGVLVPDGQTKRLLTHRDISAAGVQESCQLIREFFAR